MQDTAGTGAEAILIPVKQLDDAKRRLSERLSPADRRLLGLAMLADVLRATQKWPNRLIVTSDRDAEAVGLAFACRLVADPGQGLNAAVAAGTRAALRSGAAALLILPSDEPMVTQEDVAGLFACPEHVVIAPSPDGGTNGLLRRPPDAMGTAFGPDSASQHRELALRAGLSLRTAQVGSLMLDIDRYSDLVQLASMTNRLESARLAVELLAQGRSGNGRGTQRGSASVERRRPGTPDGPDPHPYRAAGKGHSHEAQNGNLGDARGRAGRGVFDPGPV